MNWKQVNIHGGFIKVSSIETVLTIGKLRLVKSGKAKSSADMINLSEYTIKVPVQVMTVKPKLDKEGRALVETLFMNN